MNTERSLQEIADHPYYVIDGPQEYRAISGNYEEDFKETKASLILVLENIVSGEKRKILFLNVSLNEPVFTGIRDATGFYFVDTAFLNWSPSQRIEVGDADGGPPLFWAESFCDKS